MPSESVQRELAALRLKIHRSRNAVLPIVGAGLSLPVPWVKDRTQRLPLWWELLEDLIAKIPAGRERDRLADDLKKDKYLDVASSVADLLGRDAITTYIDRTFKAPPFRRPGIYEAVAKLPVDHFATTNFDPWLAQAAIEHGRSDLRVLTPWHPPALHDLGVGSLPYVFMLHGDARTAQECVLTLESYDQLQHGNPVYLKLLSALANQREFLFLGYSLGDPDLLVSLASWQVQFGGPAPRHTLLATDVHETDRRRLAKRGVQIVEYATDKNYGALADVLAWLATPPPGITTVTLQHDPTRYLDSLLGEVRHIELRGVGSGRTGQGANLVAIERLYTSLRTQGTAQSRGDLGALRPRDLPLTDLVRSHHRLLVEGQPGSGKTTFVRFVTSLLARDRRGEPCPGAASWRQHYLGGAANELDLLPVFVRASELVDRLAATDGEGRADLLLDHLAVRWREADYGIARSFWAEELRQGRAILFVDGLDEIADPTLRERMFAVFRDACQWRCRIVVTSRPIATEALQALGFERAVVEPFDTASIATFLDLWVRALYDKAIDAALENRDREYHEQLRAAILDRPRIRKIAKNPVMLTSLCVVHWNERDLPEGQSRVYAAVLRWLLDAKASLRRQHQYSEQFAKTALARLALSMMRGEHGKRAFIDLQGAAEAIEPTVQRHFPELQSQGERNAHARQWLRFEALHSGILQEIAKNQLRFWHLTFQEYLAAYQLTTLGDDLEGDEHWWPLVKPHLHDAQWRETIDMFPCCLLDDGGGERRVDRLLERVQGKAVGNATLEVAAATAAVTGRLLQPLSVCGYKAPAAITTAFAATMQRAMAIFEVEGAKQVPWHMRITVAEALGRGGDPRLAPGLHNFLAVPTVPGLLLGKFPVTVREFQEFVDDEGYHDRRWWTEAGWALREAKQWTEPGNWEQQLEYGNRPVTEVSWYEAAAYCAWMTERYEAKKLLFSLPNRNLWEAAASAERGDYPWGEPQPDEERTNFELKIGRTTPVGMYPSGAGRYGHLDLAGNVCEWSDNSLKPSAGDQHLLERGEFERRNLHGGAFFFHADDLRVEARTWHIASGRAAGIGFRVAISPTGTA